MNNSLKTVLVSVGVSVVVVFGVYYFFPSQPIQQVIQNLGAQASPDVYNTQHFYSGIDYASGQLVLASTSPFSAQSPTSTTLTAQQLCANSDISWTPAIGSSTFYWAASSTQLISTCLQQNNASREVWFRNASGTGQPTGIGLNVGESTASTTWHFVGGTTTANAPTSTNLVSGSLASTTLIRGGATLLLKIRTVSVPAGTTEVNATFFNPSPL